MKKSVKTLFAASILHLYEKKFSNLRPLLSITFPQGFRKSKMLGYWTLGSGGKQTNRHTYGHLNLQNESAQRADSLKTLKKIPHTGDKASLDRCGQQHRYIKNPASKAKFAEKKRRKKISRQFYTLYEQKFSNRRPLLSITFPQGFRKSKKFGHWTLGSVGKKTFKRSEQIKKICKKLILPRQFYTLYEKKFSSLRPLLSITFPPRIQKI